MASWFTVERLDEDTWVVSEYRHWEHTHCYLLLGRERASRFHSHFSRIEFTPGGGEKCHRTFADHGGYGPNWAPLAAEVARRGWNPTFICARAGTQAEDAVEMKRTYQAYLKAT